MGDGGSDQRIREANQAVRRFIRSLPGHRVTAEHRAEYERLVAVYIRAVRDRDDADEEAALAAWRRVFRACRCRAVACGRA